MKKIRFTIYLCMTLIFAQLNVFAAYYTPQMAVSAIIPYEDNHEVTRLEALRAMNRMIGVNDNVILSYCWGDISHYTPKIDIKYKTYMGRFMDIGIRTYADKDLYSKERLNGDNRFFGGDDYATVLDIISWMVICLDKENEHYPDDISEYKAVMADKAIEYGLLNKDENYDFDRKLSANELRIFSDRFFREKVGRYYFDDWDRIEYNQDDDFKYIDLFNETYKDTVITIKNDGIYQGDARIESDDFYYITDDGVMMIPVRLLAELTGYDDEIVWNEENQTVLMTKIWNTEYDFKSQISLTMWSQECTFPNSLGTFEFENYTRNINDRMYVPMREMLENFAYDVIWDVE